VTPTDVLRRTIIILTICGLAALATTASAADSSAILRQTMAKIDSLNSRIADRQSDGVAIRDALLKKLQAVKTEALEACRKNDVKTLAEALNDPKLFYDLKLMAEIQAYSNRYTQKIDYYRVAGERLSYLHQQADDALKIVDTLSGMKIDTLIAQSEKVIADYLPEAQTIIIHPATLIFDPPQKIWQTLKTGT
jgi:5'(3')-deoxyribonucleotidase